MSPAGDVILRREYPSDRSASVPSTKRPFGRPNEADLIDRLRYEGVVLASFVAEVEARIVGHILFSRVLMETNGEPVSAARGHNCLPGPR